MGWIISRALYEKWPCSQELEAAYLGGICSDGKQSALSNGSHTQLAYLSQDKMTEFSRLSRFGMMFKPLTESRGEDLLTWFREGFLVRTYPAPERAQELKEADQECGSTWHELSMKYDLDSHSWRIHRSLFPEDLSPSLVTLPKWGMMRDGALFQHLTAERPISGTESGLWRTPTVGMLNADRAKDTEYAARKEAKGQTITLADQVRHERLWPTPRSCSAMASSITQESAWNQDRFPNLETMVGRRTWPTPQSSDNRDRGNLGSGAIQRRQEKGKQIMLSQSVSDISGALNPPWVEWLMAWPLGWTDLNPLEMDKFHAWQQQLSES